MTKRMTEGARRERLPPSFLAFSGLAAQRSHAQVLPLLNLKKKRDSSQSIVQGKSCMFEVWAFSNCNVRTKVKWSYNGEEIYMWGTNFFKPPLN